MMPDGATPLPLHLGQCLLWAATMLAPVPLALAVLRPGRGNLAGAPPGTVLLALLVVWSVLQTALALLLGLLGLLHLPGLLAGEALLLAAGLIWLRRASRRSREERRREREEDVRRPAAEPPSTVAAGLGLVLGALGLAALWNLLRAPTDNFDSLVYHLPAMVRWVQDGHLLMDGDATYPMSWELLGTLCFLPVREDLLVALPNLLAWLQLGLAVGLLAERLGAGRTRSLAAATLLLAVPSVVGRLDAIQPDLAVAAAFAAALLFAHRHATTGGGADLLLFLACLAQLPGLKLSAPVYVALLVAVLLLLRAGRLRDAGRPRRELLRLDRLDRADLVRLLGGLPVLLLVAGYWYGRNWVLTGNPTGILDLEVGGVQLLSGHVTRDYLARTSLAAVFDAGSAADWQVLWQVGREWLGLPFLALLLLALTALAAGLLRRRGAERREQMVLFALLAVTAVYYWCAPYSGDNGQHGWRVTPWIHAGLRFGFPALALLGVAGALGLRVLRLDGTAVLILPVAAAVLAVLFNLRPPAWSFRVAVLLALVAAAAWLRRPAGWPRAVQWRAAVAAGLVFLAAGWLARAAREDARASVYGDGYRQLEERVAPRAVIGTVNLMQGYPLAGRHWTRRVKVLPPAPPDRSAWLASLRRDGVSVLAVGAGEPAADERVSVARVRSWLAAPDAPVIPLQEAGPGTTGPRLYLLRR